MEQQVHLQDGMVLIVYCASVNFIAKIRLCKNDFLAFAFVPLQDLFRFRHLSVIHLLTMLTYELPHSRVMKLMVLVA